MKNKTNDLLDDFLSDDEKKENVNKKKVVKERSGLIERINRVLVTPDGRQLLSE